MPYGRSDLRPKRRRRGRAVSHASSPGGQISILSQSPACRATRRLAAAAAAQGQDAALADQRQPTPGRRAQAIGQADHRPAPPPTITTLLRFSAHDSIREVALTASVHGPAQASQSSDPRFDARVMESDHLPYAPAPAMMDLHHRQPGDAENNHAGREDERVTERDGPGEAWCRRCRCGRLRARGKARRRGPPRRCGHRHRRPRAQRAGQRLSGHGTEGDRGGPPARALPRTCRCPTAAGCGRG